jgi:hypothetical protein
MHFNPTSMNKFEPNKVDIQEFVIFPYKPSVYNKPLGKSFLYFYALGPGGDGGTDGGAGGGGGGGGAQTVALIPAKLLPDTIYLFEAIISSGGSKPVLIIAIQPPLTTSYTSKDSSIIILAYGGIDSSAGSGTGGAGGAAMSTTSYDGKFFGLGIMDSVAGQDGQNGSGGTMYLPTTGVRATGGNGGSGSQTYSIRAKSGGGGIFPNVTAGSNYSNSNTSTIPYMNYGGIWDINDYPHDGSIGSGGVGQDLGAGRNPGVGGPGFVMIAAW